MQHPLVACHWRLHGLPRISKNSIQVLKPLWQWHTTLLLQTAAVSHKSKIKSLPCCHDPSCSIMQDAELYLAVEIIDCALAVCLGCSQVFSRCRFQ